MSGSRPPRRQSTMSSHGRINSTDERRRVAIPRRSTKGPLDVVDDDPLTALSPSQNASSTVDRSPSRPTRSPAPRLQSPTTAQPTVLPPKDFSFLQDASAYHVLPASNIPPPFLNAPNIPSVSSPIGTLLLSGHYRLAAIAAARNLVTSTPSTDYTILFHFVHIRLACLSKVFGDLNPSLYYADQGMGGRGTHLVPWELRILVGVMGYYELARECREAILSLSTDEEKEMWRARLRDCGIRVANVLVEMGDLEGREVAVMETLTWLRLGDITAARRCLSSTSSPEEENDGDELAGGALEGLIQLADSDYTAAASTFEALYERFPSDAMLTQNLAVCLLYTGRIAEARELLSGLVNEGQPFHFLVFNLCTVYELCTERNRDSTMGLASQMATRRGDGSVGW
ncbi:hypothetical protein BU23DRAFT_577872 [Bimuria novae-zelandiae CBS 107.79]|uniref:TPR-like protein n=1 Tax=Bimuria novae-zelandiae CBS 107.79 TaxID=1447943 RepID=A0A6A5VQL4_9PLEO|nr:hypothetical protein BU23DRAFT_577872 [Bimuria novae-zelandiae CBS 107.79]